MKQLPSQEALRGLFSYSDGEFRWLKSRGRAKAGTIAGHRRALDGRNSIRVDGVTYLASRLAWQFVYGEDPGDLVIDHVDRDPTNDRIENLRILTQQENMQNIERGQGYSRIGDRFYARIYKGGRQICLGGHDTPEQAHQAYLEAIK
jgi:hypothetical protein